VKSLSMKYIEDGRGGEYAPKILLLGALSYYKTGDIKTAINILEKIKEAYKDMEVAAKANELLAIIQKLDTEFIPEKSAGKQTQFVLNFEENHFFIISMNYGSISPDSVKMWVSEYISKNYPDNTIEVRTLMLNDKLLIVCGSFKGRKPAFDFYIKFLTDFPMYDKLPAPDIFIISETNMKKLISEGDMEGYLRFFRKNYL